MNRKRKTELDLIGRELFAQAGLEAESIEKIASRPDAYSSILARIKEESLTNSEYTKIESKTSRFGIQHFAVALMALIVVSVVSFSLIYSDKKDDFASQQRIEFPVPPPETARPQTPPPEVIESEQPIGRAKYPEAVIEKASAKKPSPRRVRDSSSEPPLAEFVSLGLSSSPQHTADGGRVIRVELPAASLFAMGVNVPIENGSEVFKADLIVGADGVTRAVKLVE